MIGYHWIAMLDILGFRPMVQAQPLTELSRLVERLFVAAKPTDAAFHFQAPDGGIATKSLTLGHLHFSDTIMLWTPPLDRRNPDANTQMFVNLCQSVGNLIGLALINGIPLRGGLAGGECYIDPLKQIAIGQPIIDAYLLEQEQEWIGAAVASKGFPKLKPFDSFSDRLVKYAVPTKTRMPVGHLLAVDWTGFARMPEAMTRRFWKMNARLETEKALAEGAKLSKGTSAHQKWKNTAAFYKVQLKCPSYWVAVRPDAKTGYRIEKPT
jgi:hypothetical protein